MRDDANKNSDDVLGPGCIELRSQLQDMPILMLKKAASKSSSCNRTKLSASMVVAVVMVAVAVVVVIVVCAW